MDGLWERARARMIREVDETQRDYGHEHEENKTENGGRGKEKKINKEQKAMCVRVNYNKRRDNLQM